MYAGHASGRLRSGSKRGPAGSGRGRPREPVEANTARSRADRAAAVRDASGIAVGDPILAAWPGRAAARVRDLPWVDDAKVVRDLPGSVRIDVVPRVPVGWTKAGARVLVVDGESRVIERLDTPPPGVPELTGV
ncbi:MAG: FtsQ-type POTRA domain-containing protein, partial [Candidatus Eisenbacteria bacterium]